MKKIIGIIMVLGLVSFGGYLSWKEYTEKEHIWKNLPKEETKEQMEITEEEKEIANSLFKDHYKEAKKILKNMTLEEKIGQLFLVRYDKNEINNQKKYYPGGYILFAKDFENQTKESIKNEITNAQNMNKYPLIMAVDEEGGYVTRISRFKAFREEKFQSPKYYFETGGYDLLEQTEREKANLLKEIGINLNLAPVADVSTNPNDFIYNRTFGRDASKTAELIGKMVEYANQNKINSCLKHFPGYGNNEDTHTGIAIDNRSYENFVENDFLPFKKGIEAKVPTILISHNIINCLDSSTPASLSEKVIMELRNTLNFTGIIMTDDLAMSAVKEYVENKEAATLAIKSGNDMIITSDFETMYEEIKKAITEDRLDEKIIDKAVLRIMAWKYYSNLME